MPTLYVPQLIATDLGAIQTYVATTAVGSSSVFSYPANTKVICQKHLALMDLTLLRDLPKTEMELFLDLQTRSLVRKLLRNEGLGANERYFGVARKVINIFLHNAYYNQFLCKEYKLNRHVQTFEVPLDSLVAYGIRNDCRDLDLPVDQLWRWQNLRLLRKPISDHYQATALMIANAMRTQRVHLDSYYYPGGWEWRFA